VVVTATLGYARVSTTGQDLDAQVATLSAAGVDAQRVFTDTLSGSAKTARPGLAAMLDYARPGDTVVVAAVDRVGRSVAEVTAPSPISVSTELRCAPCAKASIPAPEQGAPWQPSWPPSPNSSSSWAASAGQPPANRVDPGACRPPSRRS